MTEETISKVKDGFSHQKMNILNAFLQGHLIVANGEQYRYANKNEELFSKGDQVFIANESGIFKAFITESTQSVYQGMRWIFVSDSLSYISSIIDSMSQDEVIIALSNKTLTDINKKDR